MTAMLSAPPPDSLVGRRLDHHVAKSAAWLDELLLTEPSLEAASTFVSMAEAEQAIAAVMASNAEAIAAWLAEGARGTTALEAPFAGGLVRVPGGYSAAGAAARVLLRSDGRGGYLVVAAHPVP